MNRRKAQLLEIQKKLEDLMDSDATQEEAIQVLNDILKDFGYTKKDYVAENERILNEWRNHLNHYEYFAPDGIMYKGEIRGAYKYYNNENNEYKFRWIRIPSGKENILWTKAPLRILFLTKDQNANDDTAWDVRSETYWSADDNITPKDRRLDTYSRFNKTLVYILYGILNTTTVQPMDYNNITNKNALSFVDDSKCIFARINCKKEVGGKKCENSVLKKAIDRDMYFLKQQILNIDADILVCCGNQKGKNLILNTVKDIYRDEFEYVPCVEGKGTGMHYNKRRNKLVIDAYHLAFFGKGGLKARYDETVGMYYEFLKYLKKTEGIDFSASHRQK